MDNTTPIANSDFMSFVGYRITSETSAVDAFHLPDPGPATTCAFNVAIMLDRVKDPKEMLAGDWASRQKALSDPDLWSKYGADPDHYEHVKKELTDAGLTLIPNGMGSNDNYYTSTVENRTIWVQLSSAAEFNTLFGSGPTDTILQQDGPDGMNYWDVDLSLPADWGVVGLWFDNIKMPDGSDLTTDPAATLPDGPQGTGNSGQHDELSPPEIAALYNFPLLGRDVKTGTIGLMEPNVGSWLSTEDPYGSGLEADLQEYLSDINVTGGTGKVSVQGLYGQNGDSTEEIDELTDNSGERSLDIAIAASINPNSDIQLFNGSGVVYPNATATVFTAVQAAIWSPVNGVLPEVTSNSFADTAIANPASPFHRAYWELYIDAVLKNQTTVTAAGDGGSSGLIWNGLTNVRDTTKHQAYNLTVGGTSLSSQHAAMTDATLGAYTSAALQGNLDFLQQLVAGGLKVLPSSSSDIDHFIETVWNQYSVSGTTISGYLSNEAGSGGVDVTQPTPWYQTDYGLTPTTTDSLHQVGRGVPDVSMNSDGNLKYFVPSGDFSETGGSGGTSASAPMWASLIVQFNYIFQDQKLRNLGFMNDLLYIASAIAPGSFNDITVGNNNSSFYLNSDGTYTILDGSDTYPATVYNTGYSAGDDYDLVSGLGTPNGVLLGRALTAIAHAQTSYGDKPGVLDTDGSSGWKSGVDQALLFQTTTESKTSASIGIDVNIGDSDVGFFSGLTQSYAWTARLAQQVLQHDFDPNLVRLFDRAGQAAVIDTFAADGDAFSVSLNSVAGNTAQVNLTNDYGFVDFAGAGGTVRVARAVEVAEMPEGKDQDTIVRLRQNGQDSLAIKFYKVDDLTGAVGGIKPGEAGYAAKAEGNLYHLADGSTMLSGRGYGLYSEGRLTDVHAGDHVAMALVNVSQGQTYWAFSQANPDGQGHLWSYGLHTFGWEDTRGGGDHDFNDLIVQLDFTSAAGNGLLV